MAEAWVVILFFCAADPPCTPRYWPQPFDSNYACARAAIVLRRDWEADGAVCTREVPEGVKALPGRVQRGRWARDGWRDERG